MKRSILFLALVAQIASASADSNAELKKQLDEALQLIRDLKTRVNTLESKQAIQSSTVVKTGGAPAPQEAPVIAPASTPDKSVAGADKARVEFSGQVMFDAIYDFKSVDPEWNSTLRPSKIPVYCSDSGGLRDAGCGKDGETIFSVRQTKLAFKGFFPTELGELKTLFDIDLFDVGGGSTNMRVLDAWGELGPYGAGQYYTLFMDIDVFPNTIDYWGPNGMIFVRNPQLRYTAYDHEGLKLAFSLEAPGSAIDTGKINLVDPTLGSGISSRTEIPDLIAALRYDSEWGHVQGAAMYRKMSFETTANADSDPSGSKDGYGLNLTGVLNTGGNNRIVAQFAIGDGIASYMNDGGTDVGPADLLTDPQAEAVQSIGWLLYYDHYWNESWSSSIGYSEHEQDTTEGQLFNAFKKGSYASANLLWYPVKNVTTGAEFIWGRRENKDGNSGKDTRVQFSSKFAF